MGCIFLFALLGVYAGTVKLPDEAMMDVLRRTLGETTMLVLNVALIVSAVSTLDSTLSSASKLAIKDMGLARPTLMNGRLAMLAFMAGGLGFLFLDTKELYAAVAISGTASMFLTPVILFCIIGGRRVSLWAFHVAFVAAVSGAVLYYLETSNLGFMTASFRHRAQVHQAAGHLRRGADYRLRCVRRRPEAQAGCLSAIRKVALSWQIARNQKNQAQSGKWEPVSCATKV
jgi:hypothetical protein